jgi:glycosidase
VPVDFWAEFRRTVKELKPDAYLVGEAWHAWGSLLGVFDGLMNYRLRRRLLDFCLDDSADAEDLAVDAEALLAEAGSAFMLNLLGSHDTPRLLTLARGDVDRTALALTALLTFPGTPLLYYGDEHGVEGEDDPDCRRAVVWSEERWNRRIYEAVRRLIALRRAHPALRRGSWSVELAFNRVLAFRRHADDDEIVVVLNAGPARQNVEIPVTGEAGNVFEDALSGVRYRCTDSLLVLHELPARTALVLRPAGADGP